MQKTKTFYWIITVLFSAFMVFSAVPDVLSKPEAIKFMSHLGYPNYILPFLGIAKILGVIAILIPGYPLMKEWAYAGLTYDLLGAVYSMVAVEGLKPQESIMLLPFIFIIISYRLYHKIRREKAVATEHPLNV